MTNATTVNKWEFLNNSQRRQLLHFLGAPTSLSSRRLLFLPPNVRDAVNAHFKNN